MTDNDLTPCPFCKTLIPRDCRFCDTCGEKLRRCQACGSFAKSKRCTTCGSATDEIVAPAPVAANATVRPSVATPTPGHLVCVRGGLRIGLAHDAIIGRRGSYGSAFQIFPTISGTHARLVQQSSDWLIEDVGSSYGTFINGTQIAKHTPTPIHVGDVVRFSDIDFKVTE